MRRKTDSKKKLGLFLAAVLAAGMMLPASAVHAEEKVTIEYQARDISVIPDKYSTGCKGELTPFKEELEDTVYNLTSLQGKLNGEDAKIWIKKGGASYNFNFYSYNKDVSGELVFENIDFRKNTILLLDEDKIDRDITVVFNNCKFDELRKGWADSRVLFKFNNCSIRVFKGSNAEFDKCSFGGSYEDPIMIVRNVKIYNSYIYDLNYAITGITGEPHIDGTQIFGETGIDAKNLLFKNCRFEVPHIRLEGNQAKVNACIMLQLERSNVSDVDFEDCVLNGGGAHTIYAAGKGDWTYANVSFNNIRIGASRDNNALHTIINKNIDFQDVAGTDALYVGSVMKENGTTVFSVTNDTAVPRRLRILTDSGADHYYDVKAGPTGATLLTDEFKQFSDIPADIPIDIHEDAEYAVCFDVTDPNNIRQIRFVNYSGKPVTVDRSVFGTDEAQNNDYLVDEDFDGNRVKLHYTISKDYVLTISGSGPMANYGTARDAQGNSVVLLPPWNDYKDYIRKVVIEDGITYVSLAAFKEFFAVESVELGKDVANISGGAFRCCSMLKYITFPETLKSENVGKDAFASVVLENDMYEAIANGTVIEEPMPSDLNGDRSVNDTDCALLLKHIAGSQKLTNAMAKNANVNKDTFVDTRDVIATLKTE